MLADEKTLITVSDEVLPLLLTFVINSATSTPKAISETSSFLTPKSTPKAIPVKAECPKAKECPKAECAETVATEAVAEN